jgi:Domain of unknown function (DUF4192)
MTDIADVPLRLSSSRDIVEAVPYLVGFQPEDSLVVVSMRGAGSRLGLTARVDLPPADGADACARAFVGYFKRNRATRAIIVCYPISGGLSHPSVRPIADAITARFARARIEVVDVLCVGDGRWWSLLCTDDACCPAEGTPMAGDGTSTIAVTMAVQGRLALQSRTELEHTLDPVVGVAGAAMAYALPRARAELFDRIAVGSRAEVAAESVALFRAAVRGRLASEARAGGTTALGADEAARLIVSLDDVCARDEIIAWYDDESSDAARGLAIELVRRAVPPFEVPPLTLLAWICYLQGEGALAGIALDRALAADPHYPLAQILDSGLRAAFNPEPLRRAMRGLRGLNSPGFVMPPIVMPPIARGRHRERSTPPRALRPPPERPDTGDGTAAGVVPDESVPHRRIVRTTCGDPSSRADPLS